MGRRPSGGDYYSWHGQFNFSHRRPDLLSLLPDETSLTNTSLQTEVAGSMVYTPALGLGDLGRLTRHGATCFDLYFWSLHVLSGPTDR